jgi:hypothetical protein
MKRLILTSEPGLHLKVSDDAEIAIPFVFRFVWDRLRSSDELATYVGPRTDQHGPGMHWSDYVGPWHQDSKSRRNIGLIDFCLHYDIIELWFDPHPNNQLLLNWLLDYFRPYPEVTARLKLRLVDFDLIRIPPQGIGKWKVQIADVTEAEVEMASATWQAYRSPTPEACFRLLSADLSVFPLLRPALLDLLDELPSRATGLGATEMRMLELIARGYAGTNSLFHLKTLRQTRIFNEWEHGYLLDGLAHGPMPAIAGLDEELRTLSRENLGDRLHAYHRSRLSLTEFGRAVVAHEVDFSQHNPIDRWWGGTHLTNDRLWRYDPVLTKP